MATTIETHLPEQLVKQMESLIQQGWFTDVDSLISDALRRFLDSHSPDLVERFFKEDVQWGLRGAE